MYLNRAYSRPTANGDCSTRNMQKPTAEVILGYQSPIVVNSCLLYFFLYIDNLFKSCYYVIRNRPLYRLWTGDIGSPCLRTHLFLFITKTSALSTAEVKFLLGMFSFSISAYSGRGRTYNPSTRLRTHYPDIAVCFAAEQDYLVACYLSVFIL